MRRSRPSACRLASLLALLAVPAPAWAEPAPPVSATDDDDLWLPDLTLLTAEPVHGVPSSGFGWRDDPIRHRRRFHAGADFRAGRGTEVHAAAAGTVVACGRRGGYGRAIDLDHGDGLLTRYAHLARIEVKAGQRVEADQRIGRVGSTGRTTGAHLHFEVRLDGRAVDPGVAVRVGQLALTASEAEVRAAAHALRPEVQARSVSPLDPPRARRQRPAGPPNVS